MKYSRKKLKNLVSILVTCLLAVSVCFILTASATAESGVLRQFDFSTSDAFHAHKSNIVSVTFKDTIDDLSNISEELKWDVSAVGDGSVMAWIVDTSGAYELFIGAEGGVKANTNSSNLFNGFDALKAINGLENFNTENTTNMSYMFYGCRLLKDLNLSALNVQNVKNISSMLSADRDTQSFVNMELKTLDITGWNTANFTDISEFLYGCTSLETLDLSAWNTKKLEKMNLAFANCINLKTLNISTWDLPRLAEYTESFKQCNQLSLNAQKINLYQSSYQLFKEADMARIDISSGKINSSTMNSMFKDCRNLTEAVLNNLSTSATSTRSMFENCTSLTSVSFENFNTEKISDMGCMFRNCSNLIELNLSSFVLDYYDEGTSSYKQLNLESMFESCTSLREIFVREWWVVDTSRTNGHNMFYNCSSLAGAQSEISYNPSQTDDTYATVEHYLSKAPYYIDEPEEEEDDTNDNIITPSRPTFGMTFFDRIIEWFKNFFAKLFRF